MKAIHNHSPLSGQHPLTVFNISKIQIESYSQQDIMQTKVTINCFQYFKDTNWKLFTTVCGWYLLVVSLFSIFQRYKLKAIHNCGQVKVTFVITVFNISKIQIESYSQRESEKSGKQYDCFQYFKDTNWKLFTTINQSGHSNHRLFSIFQRYKLKAIHN